MLSLYKVCVFVSKKKKKNLLPLFSRSLCAQISISRCGTNGDCVDVLKGLREGSFAQPENGSPHQCHVLTVSTHVVAVFSTVSCLCAVKNAPNLLQWKTAGMWKVPSHGHPLRCLQGVNY